MKAFPTNVAEALRLALANLGWSQKDLAHVLRRPAQLVNELARGTKRVTAATAWQLEAAGLHTAEFWMVLDAKEQLARKKPKAASTASIRVRAMAMWKQHAPDRTAEQRGGEVDVKTR